MQLAHARLETTTHTYPITDGAIESAHRERREKNSGILFAERRRNQSRTVAGLVVRGNFRLYGEQPPLATKLKLAKPHVVAEGVRLEVVHLNNVSPVQENDLETAGDHFVFVALVQAFENDFAENQFTELISSSMFTGIKPPMWFDASELPTEHCRDDIVAYLQGLIERDSSKNIFLDQKKMESGH